MCSTGGIALFSFGCCPYQPWMQFCIYNRFWLTKEVFLTLISTNAAEVTDMMLSFIAPCAVWSCIKQSSFVITRWKDRSVNLALFQSQELEMCPFSVDQGRVLLPFPLCFDGRAVCVRSQTDLMTHWHAKGPILFFALSCTISSI